MKLLQEKDSFTDRASRPGSTAVEWNIRLAAKTRAPAGQAGWGNCTHAVSTWLSRGYFLLDGRTAVGVPAAWLHAEITRWLVPAEHVCLTRGGMRPSSAKVRGIGVPRIAKSHTVLHVLPRTSGG